MQVSTIGLDLAKNVFQAHGVSAEGKVVLKKQLRRGQVLSTFAKLPPCLVGMEACAGAHYWARELRKLGHDVRLMPARDVKAYVKRDKTDAADAAAICEAVSRPSMRFVALKTPEQQGRLMQHRVRDLLLGSARRPSTRCGHTWPSWGSWRRRGGKVSACCWRSSPMPRMSACHRMRARA